MNDPMLKIIIPFTALGLIFFYLADQTSKLGDTHLANGIRVLSFICFGIPTFLVILREIIYAVRRIRNHKGSKPQ